MVHLTRFEAPFFLPISKKAYKWTIHPSPGPYKKDESIPLAILVRDYLKLAVNLREARRIISERKIFVDGRVRTDYKFPVGMMAVVAIPSIDFYYRIMPDNIKYLLPKQISKEDSKYKYIRIINKTILKGNIIQLNLEDGRNIIISKEKIKEFNLPTLTTLKIEIPSQTIITYFPLKEGNYALIIGGRNIGGHGIIKTIKYSEYKRRKYSIVTIEAADGKIYQTNLENVMSIGDAKPDLRLE
jgi:small subunit ribosomal protein S4e